MVKKNFKYIAVIAVGLAVVAMIVAMGFILAPASTENQDDSSPVQLVSSWTQVDMSSIGQTQAVLVRPMFGAANNLRFFSGDETVARVDEHGNVTAIGDGKTTITVEADVPDQDDPVVKELSVCVKRNAQEVTAPWSWKGMTAGSASGFQSIATSGMNLVYSSSDENIATVSPEGKVTAISPGTATITATQEGDANWQPASAEATVQIVGAVKDRRAALEPFYQAMEEQQKWSWDATYGGDDGTIEGSRKSGNCTTFPTASLQRVGLLEEPGSHLPHSKKAAKHPEYFEAFAPNRTPNQLVASGELIEGDIVRFDKPRMHSQVYVGQDEKGRLLWNSAGRVTSSTSNRAVLFSRIGYDNANACSILRIKTYTVSASWDGPGIMDGGGEVMAKQNCTISFHPEPGSKLVSLVVDGTPVNIDAGMESYTFEQVLEPHSIEAKFESVA